METGTEDMGQQTLTLSGGDLIMTDLGEVVQFKGSTLHNIQCTLYKAGRLLSKRLYKYIYNLAESDTRGTML